jgi:glycosyltransferase involved in cell wall biosynthesis
MNILNVSYSDLFGGAAKSAYRIHKTLNSIENIKSEMLVVKKLTNQKNIFTIDDKFTQILFKLKNYFGMLIGKLDNNHNPKSYNFFNSPILKHINSSKYDLINLHWINAETLSIEDVQKINKPFIITMHDMWWICGSENYLNYNNYKWKNGNFNNILSNYLYNKKKKINPIAIISPSKWLIECVKKGKLYKKAKLINIPYPIDQKIFFPKKKINSIRRLNLFKNKKIKIFFGVFGNSQDKRKGIDLLIKSLNKINPNLFELIIASKNIFQEKCKFDITNIDYIDSEKELSDVYNLCDLVILGSRLDNLPNIALEAQSCGKPIIAYKVGGLSDIVKNNYNGYLIKPFNINLFSKKIEILIKDKKLRKKFSKNAHKFSKKKWSSNLIKKAYKQKLSELAIN